MTLQQLLQQRRRCENSAVRACVRVRVSASWTPAASAAAVAPPPWAEVSTGPAELTKVADSIAFLSRFTAG